MTEFTHSIVLFSGDDGLPLEFNVRNTNDKSRLKAMIEHGGGLCTQSDNAIHLISPGTKVLNADMGKKLVSSRYVLDCVTENYLLEVNEYVFTISEAQTSDISDEDSGKGKESPDILNEKRTIVNSDFIIDAGERLNRNESSLTTPSKLGSQQKSVVSSNQSESFIEGTQDVNHNPRITAGLDLQTFEFIPLTSTAKEPDSMDPDYYEDIEKQLSPIQASASLVNPQKRTIVASQYEKKSSPKQVCFTTQNITSPNQASPKKVCFTTKNITSPNRATLNVQQKETLFESEDRDSSNEIFPKDDDNSRDPIRNEGAFQTYPIQSEGLTFTASPQKRSSTFPHYEQMDEDDSEDESLIPEVRLPPGLASPVHAAVSSSQPTMGGLDQFDNLLLSKAQQNAPLDDEDHLSQSYTVSSSADAQKPNSAEVDSAEMFHGGPSSQIPDSPTQVEGQLNDKSLYIQKLEAKVEEILQKPSPKSIQDKITLVKYVCCIKKMSPTAALQHIQQL